MTPARVQEVLDLMSAGNPGEMKEACRIGALAVAVAEADYAHRMMLLAKHEFGIGAELDDPGQSGRDLMDARHAYEAAVERGEGT